LDRAGVPRLVRESWGFVPILDFLQLRPYLYGATQAAGGDAKACWARYEQWLRWAWGGERERVWAELGAAAAGAEAVLQVRAAYLSEDGRAERYWNMPRPRYRAVDRNRLSLVTAA
jgi:hypothetical protein